MNRVIFKLKYRTIYKVATFFSTAWTKLIFRLNGDKIGKNFRTNGTIRVAGWEGKISIGDDVLVNSAWWATSVGRRNKTSIRVMGGSLEIGSRVGMTNAAFCVQDRIVIEDDVLIGVGSCIYDTDFHSIVPGRRLLDRGDAKPIIIHKGAFVGADCTILKGTEIGEHAVIGAGSVVAGKKIGPYEIWAGNPAKFIKKLDVPNA